VSAVADCPTPWKAPYPNPQKAHAATRRNPLQEPYHCACGVWHLASIERGKNLAKSSKAGYRDKWRQRRIRRKLFGQKPPRYTP
jgi:hypothetical protein